MNGSLVALVGAELEENLSIRYLAAAVERDGFRAEILPFNRAREQEPLADRICQLRPLVVGVSVPFQMRAKELLSLTTSVRNRGYDGHICVGGHFATFEFQAILRDFPGIDSVVRHEGEDTLRGICLALRSGHELVGIPGIVLRGPDEVKLGPKRNLPPLDDLAFPKRDRTRRAILGVPAAPIVGSRGCYGDCSFCCIYAYARNAEGARYRMRSPANVVEEMEEEYRSRGIRVFVFHDDNFFVPSTSKNLTRYREMKSLLDARCMNDLALVIKCRPNDLDPGNCQDSCRMS